MVQLDKMSKEELIEVIRIKDVLLKEMREEIDAYQILASELQSKLSIKDITYIEDGE